MCHNAFCWLSFYVFFLHLSVNAVFNKRSWETLEGALLLRVSLFSPLLFCLHLPLFTPLIHHHITLSTALSSLDFISHPICLLSHFQNIVLPLSSISLSTILLSTFLLLHLLYPALSTYCLNVYSLDLRIGIMTISVICAVRGFKTAFFFSLLLLPYECQDTSPSFFLHWQFE